MCNHVLWQILNTRVVRSLRVRKEERMCVTYIFRWAASIFSTSHLTTSLIIPTLALLIRAHLVGFRETGLCWDLCTDWGGKDAVFGACAFLFITLFIGSTAVEFVSTAFSLKSGQHKILMFNEPYFYFLQ